ncbi:MAG: hypothetical protein ACKPKO_31730, partial [Candidatus Fonsibacter sp.]
MKIRDLEFQIFIPTGFLAGFLPCSEYMRSVWSGKRIRKSLSDVYNNKGPPVCRTGGPPGITR